MGLSSMMGFESSGEKIRYAIVGLGDISQAAMMPGVSHTGNSEITALVTGDPKKARELGKKYGVKSTYSYEEFPQLLSSGEIDAIYLGTPNWMHADFIIPALEAGIHVLTEKPLEVTTAKAEKILRVASRSRAKLMVAYRLHFEPATLAAIKLIRAGSLGELRTFNSTFSQNVDPENHRTKHGALAGPLFDMGPYPVNAARYIFGAEPTEVVSAIGTRHPDAHLGDLDDTVSVTLRFPGDRIAQFTCSYVANGVNQFIVAGSKGSLEMNPAYVYGVALEHFLKIGEKESHETFKKTDQFGGEMKYFSDCILNNREPEPNGEEGFADVRVLEAIQRAVETGKPQRLPEFKRSTQINPDEQIEDLAAKARPKEVNAKSPTLK